MQFRLDIQSVDGYVHSCIQTLYQGNVTISRSNNSGRSHNNVKTFTITQGQGRQGSISLVQTLTDSHKLTLSMVYLKSQYHVSGTSLNRLHDKPDKHSIYYEFLCTHPRKLLSASQAGQKFHISYNCSLCFNRSTSSSPMKVREQVWRAQAPLSTETVHWILLLPPAGLESGS
jgi:hypothetical protein